MLSSPERAYVTAVSAGRLACTWIPSRAATFAERP
jgi:hypothetical protein